MTTPVILEPTAEPNLPPLPTLRNPEKRKDLLSTKLGDSNFRTLIFWAGGIGVFAVVV